MEFFLAIGNRCVDCENCLYICPEKCILKEKQEYSIQQWACTLCGLCQEICPVDCIKLLTIDETA